MKKKLRKIILPVSILAASQVYALGLGNLQVNSALDEALSGEIPLVLDSNENIEDIAVSLASGEDYQRVGLDKSYVPANIKVAMAERDNQKYIEITSKGPVSEPIVSLLLVVDWANGHLLREYTLLLDPPIFNSQQTQQSYSEPVQTQTYEAPSQIADVQPDPQDTTIVTASNVAPDQVIVEAGDTLWKIANRYSDGYSSPHQMMVAIFNNNPSAFQNDDMNLIKKGAILDIPAADQVAMISNGEAISEVRSQIQKWSRLQTGDDASIDYDTQSSVDYGIELTPPNDANNSDSSNSSGSSTNSSNSRILAQLSQAKEDLASSNQENEELAARIRDLEQIVADQESALSLKDTDLALLQQQLQQNKELTVVDTDSSSDEKDSSDDAVWSSDDALGTTEIEDAESDTSDQSTTEVAIDDQADDSDDLTDGTEEIVELSDEDTTDSDELAISDVVTDQAAETGVEEEKTTEISTDSTPVQTQSFMDKVLSYKTEALIGLGALLLAILGFVFFKNKGKDEDLGAGGFLDDISNNKDDEIVDDLADEIADESLLDTDATELNFSNLDDELNEEVEEISEAIDEEIDLNLEEEPEVVVMDEQMSEDDTDTFDLDLDDLDLSDIDDQNSDEVSFEESSALESDEEEDDSAAEEEQDELVEVDSDEFSLDFDLDEIVAEDDTDTEEKDSAEQLLEEDFNLDLDLNDEDQDLEEVVTDNDELNELVFDTGEHKPLEDDVDIDAETEELEFDLSEDLFSTDELELDLDDNEADDALDLTEDSGEYSIDFEGVDEGDDNEAEDIDIGLDFDDIVDDDAIDTKLDLAKAYFEMGDIDGAQQMITEIIEEGNDAQKSKAEDLRQEIEKT